VKHLVLIAFAFAFCISNSTVGVSQTVSPTQSPVRPLGLQPIGPVMLSGSDARSREFNQVYLPQVQATIREKLVSGKVFDDLGTYPLDADKLLMPYAAQRPIRLYFIDEGAGYQNTLGFTYSLIGSDVHGTEVLLFPNASKAASGSNSWNLGSPQTARTIEQPLNTGDFLDIGNGGAGWLLDFFIISQGATGGQHKLWADKTRNMDKTQHVVAFQIPQSTYLIISFEDMLYGGDADYEDLILVADIGFDYQKPFILPH
jgi:hypothetical protein